ncbi:MAG TPA: bifunctional diaminohydroxyphosphoribosylaminopyrimidine deaminase/5-amino-6-(5-phosphoribosylamino)uracil reductase RibD [Chitinophagaceae bacterium]|nr:bifunctional diaminohydroxyphosphoribosylaminopyrimidine deaminase/5-amino-6-(5-phosphoribosylamino)uracil reductase RibD [Chitinophagaceae bacterium]
MDKDELYMYRCLELAKLAAGNVAPNPMVGAVLVHDEKIIGEGYHQKFGEAHAEVNCIKSVKEENKHLIEKSTLYVSLEPCSHFGKTPPCTDLIIKNKIPKVVIGCRDVYKEVDRKGIKKLEHSGVEVITGVLEKECNELNKRFFTFHEKQRPYIILKWAESANEKIGIDAGRVLISNEYTNRLVHKWRSEEAAILVGRKTALKDDPSLTTRLYPGNNPIRCVTDNDLTLPPWLTLFDRSTATIVFNLLKEAEEKNIKWVELKDGDTSTLVTSMYNQDIQSVIVEGGATLLQSFINADLWDEARIIRNEQLTIEKGINSPGLKNARLQQQEKYFNDTISYFLPLS